MKVEIWSDVVCPWCYIGKRNLEAALAVFEHGDEVAERFESYEPAEADERSVEECLLERATVDRARSERQLVDAVIATRSKGLSWQRIGAILGTSAQAARQRYGTLIEST